MERQRRKVAERGTLDSGRDFRTRVSFQSAYRTRPGADRVSSDRHSPSHNHRSTPAPETLGTTLIPNATEQRTIRAIRSMRDNSLTLQRIAKVLSDRSMPTKTGKSARWTHQAMARILKRGE